MIVLAVLGAILIAFLVYIAVQPPAFTISRSATKSAPLNRPTMVHSSSGACCRSRMTGNVTTLGLCERPGFAIRRGIAWRANPDLAALDLAPDARFSLRRGADITVTIEGRALRLLSVHLRAGCTWDDPARSQRLQCAELAEQASRWYVEDTDRLGLGRCGGRHGCIPPRSVRPASYRAA